MISREEFYGRSLIYDGASPGSVFVWERLSRFAVLNPTSTGVIYRLPNPSYPPEGTTMMLANFGTQNCAIATWGGITMQALVPPDFVCFAGLIDRTGFSDWYTELRDIVKLVAS